MIIDVGSESEKESVTKYEEKGNPKNESDDHGGGHGNIKGGDCMEFKIRSKLINIDQN